MTLRNVIPVALLLLSPAACKGKSSSSVEKVGESTTTPPPTGTATPPAGTATPPATTPPAAAPATLAASAEPAFGCFAWSATAKAAACITGSRSVAEPAAFAVEYVGGTAAATTLGAEIVDSAAKVVNEALAKDGYTPLPPAKPLADGAALDLGKGTTLTWTRKETQPSGENQPPTHENKVTARCGGADVPVLTDETEGDDPKVSVRTAGDHAIVEMLIHYAREGENGDDFHAAVLDTTTCKVVATN